MKKRTVSLFLCLSLMLALTPALALPASASTNGHTQAEAVAWAKQQIGKKLDYDGAYGAQCVDLIKYYYVYLGNGGYAKGNACDYVSNALPSGWTRVKSNPQPGDVIVWGANTMGGPGWNATEYGHVGIVVAVNGGKLTTVEQIAYKSTIQASRETSYATCFIRPDFTSVKNLTINFHINGGTLNSAEFTANGAGIVQRNGQDVINKWAYGTGSEEYGLWNASSFGLTREGYTFIGWGRSQDGSGTLFDQDDTTLKAEDIDSRVKDGSASVTLYAVWQPTDTAVYAIAPKCAPDSCLDVENSGRYNGANVQIWENKSGKNQQWAIIPVGDGWYKLMPQHSPKALDVAGQGTTSGTNVQQYVYAQQHNAQKWKLEDAGDGYYYIIPKGNTDLCLDVYDRGSANGTNVQVWSRNGTDAQKWKLTQVSGTPGEFSSQSHVHDYTAEVTKPTCTEKGFTTHTCKSCGDNYVDNQTPALGHSFASGVCTRCGAADPASNPNMKVTGVKLSKTALTMERGQAETLTATVEPATAENTAVTWTSNAPSVASVTSDGRVSALASGAAVVTVTTDDGGFTATCRIIVKGEDKPTPKEVHFPRANVYNQGQFTDVPANQWYTDGVKQAFEFGLMKGISGKKFNPQGNVTLAEAITMAARIHSIYTTGAENFTPSGKWYQVYLDYAFQNGIISYAYYNSDVNKNATRAQFAEIFAGSLPEEALAAMNDVEDGAIPDVPMTEAYASHVYKLYRAGILAGGDARGTFSPSSYITRQECAAIVARMAESNSRVSFTLG